MGPRPHEPLDRFDDLLDPADDAAVLAALQVVRTDLLRGPDQLTARRHLRRLRDVTAPSPVRRTVAAAAVAVVATGVALGSLGDVVVATSPATGTSAPSGPGPTGSESEGTPEPDLDGPVRFDQVPSADPARSAPPFAGTLPDPADLAPVRPRVADLDPPAAPGRAPDRGDGVGPPDGRPGAGGPVPPADGPAGGRPEPPAQAGRPGSGDAGSPDGVRPTPGPGAPAPDHPVPVPAPAPAPGHPDEGPSADPSQPGERASGPGTDGRASTARTSTTSTPPAGDGR